MNTIPLNLARAWRPRNFDEIVGQELAIKLVKNSLYKNQLFPVYLLAGQRGCGKTTLGRVFAGAINCLDRPAFCQKPHEVKIPCLHCISCESMRAGTHPDFYEIDAASHTGVDTIRGLIEAASFMPGLGTKKIYLIDEAHMLSKAAFNALLKVLEEPPASVIFMLATTDPHKVLDTVKSRCFQLFLSPLEPSILQVHLEVVCTKEGITYDNEGLQVIAHESEGSVRDALNMVERLKLAYGTVAYKRVAEIIGDIQYTELIALFKALTHEDLAAIVTILNTMNFKLFSSQQVWRKSIELLRALIWLNAGVELTGVWKLYTPHLCELAPFFPLEKAVKCMDLWYHAEPLFVKSHMTYALLEMLFIRMKGILDEGNEKLFSRGSSSLFDKKTVVVQKAEEKNDQDKPSVPVATALEPQGPWLLFLEKLGNQDDPLVMSIFKQAVYRHCVENKVKVTWSHHNIFFKELLNQTYRVWQPLLEHVFGAGVVLDTEFSADVLGIPANAPAKGNEIVVERESAKRVVLQEPFKEPVTRRVDPAFTNTFPARPTYSRPAPVQAQRARLDVRDANQWKKVHLVLKHFPGMVTEDV